MAYPPSIADQGARVVSFEDYRYALTNFRIAHEKVERQRAQLEEQERQVAALRERIAVLEGKSELPAGDMKQGGSSVDDFSIKNAASRLEKLINRWAAEIVKNPPAHLDDIRNAASADIVGGSELDPYPTTPIIVQNLLRHALSETISEGIVNSLIVTNSSEANFQLTRIHDFLFSRDPTVACVWRRQTFSASVEAFEPEMSLHILSEQVPSLTEVLGLTQPSTPNSCLPVIDSAYAFAKMLHGSKSTSGGTTDTFYRAFIPEVGSVLYARQIELVKRCIKSESGQIDRVGATVFPGLVKVSKGPPGPDGTATENIQTVVRRAQVMCQCALTGTGHALVSESASISITSN